ncbi:transposase [Cucumis melo var. makuwa]|uniref:Transposase n=1 Tax=Cucumis melo var. makuwa TaxID=1194695 RepID=A0A5A7V630_CUCMM|nr:transposase [Cucumis melo var. makuwa]
MALMKVIRLGFGIDVTQVEKLQEDIVITLCLLEKYFPPSFFTIMVHLTVHLVREVKLCGPIYLRWMYPFERFMKVIKNAVRNRNRPEGCIAEGYILEEAVEFCSEFLCGVDSIGLGCQKLRDNSEYSKLGRPLSSGVTSILERELLYQAHRYVLENTVDVQPYIEKHLIALQQQHRSRSKNQKWIQDEHNRTLEGDVEGSDNLRWIAHGPYPVVTTYNSYAINGCHYHTKSHDKNKTVQNSGVSLVAKTMQVAIFKCDWVENSGGIKTDELGFVSVYLSRVGHKNDSFIFATQAKQVFFVEDPSDSRWSIVLTPPQRDFADQYNDDELGDTVLNCQGMPKATIDIEYRLDLDENTPTYIHSYTMELPTAEDLTLGLDEVEIGLDNAHTEHLEQVDVSKNEKKKTRGLTLMHDVTRIKSTGEKTVVEYNENGIPIGENEHKLQSFIGSCVHHHIPITHASWKGAFVVDGRSKKAIMKTAGVSFCQFKSWLTTQYIIPFMDEPQLLIDPPSLYAHIIDKPVWQEFVRSRMSSEFQKLRREQQDRRKRSKYTHNMSRRGYANLVEDMDEILDKAPNEESPNDALTQALGTPEYDGRVRGVGGFITPTVYFHQAKPRKSKKVNTTQQIIDENEALRKRIRELEQKVQSILTSEHGSCSKSKVQEKEKGLENVVKEKKGIATSLPLVSLTSKKKIVEEEEVKEEEVIATTPMTKNEVKSSRPMTKEVEVTSEPSNLPIQLKYILRYAERVMVDGFSFSFQLPLELFDPSLISSGHSTQEIRARNLCSRLMTSKQDQLVVAPYNPGDHWSLVIINPYDDVVYHLNSSRTSSRDDIKYVTNMALTIFQSQKNLKKTRKTTFWKVVKCPLKVGTVECGYYVMRYMREILSKNTSIITDAIDTRNSYSQLELDEVRVEWAEFLSRYI